MTLFENVMKASFKLTGVHESFVVDRGMMKGFGSTVVEHFTFGVRSNKNKANKVMNR